MADLPFIILTCKRCQVKNRVRSYAANRIPVCSKCKARLVEEDENEVHSRYGESLNKFFDLPEPGLRSDPKNGR